MKGKLEFDLPSEENEFRQASNALGAFMVVWGMDGWLRLKMNDGHEFADADTALDAMRVEFNQLCEDNRVSTED